MPVCHWGCPTAAAVAEILQGRVQQSFLSRQPQEQQVLLLLTSGHLRSSRNTLSCHVTPHPACTHVRCPSQPLCADLQHLQRSVTPSVTCCSCTCCCRHQCFCALTVSRGTLVGCKGPAVHAPAVHACFNGSGLLAFRRRPCTWQQLPPSAALPAVQRPTAVLLPDRHVAHPESSGKYCSKLLQAQEQRGV